LVVRKKKIQDIHQIDQKKYTGRYAIYVKRDLRQTKETYANTKGIHNPVVTPYHVHLERTVAGVVLKAHSHFIYT